MIRVAVTLAVVALLLLLSGLSFADGRMDDVAVVFMLAAVMAAGAAAAWCHDLNVDDGWPSEWSGW